MFTFPHFTTTSPLKNAKASGIAAAYHTTTSFNYELTLRTPSIRLLSKALKDLREEVEVLNNRTFGNNLTYPVSKEVSLELAKLFQPESKDSRAHYYHNVTGSFKGTWNFDEEIASRVNNETELILLPTPTTDEKAPKTTTSDSTDANGTSTASPDKPVTSDAVPDSAKEADDKPADTIEDNKPKYKEDVDKFRGSFRFNESGTFVFNLKETKASENVNWVKGNWRLRHEDNEDNGIALNVQGVHFVHNGSFFMWGTPEEHRIPIWRVLDLMPNNFFFQLAAAAINEQYQTRIKTLEDVLAGHGNLDYPESVISEASSCHYQMYMQLGAVDPSVRSSALKDLEREWAAPQGVSTIKAPHLNSSLFIYSPNCRLTLAVKNAEGMKREKFYSKAVNYAGMAGTLAFIQVFLLVRQMEYTPTPSSVAKVSYWTIALQVFADSYLCMLHLTTGVLV
ncbi:hypothetical protein BGX31_006258, partial [Mortierella sp. GBA43]